MCPQLARIEGLAKGAAAVTGVTRYTDQEGKTVRTHEGMSVYIIFCINGSASVHQLNVRVIVHCKHRRTYACIAMFNVDCTGKDKTTPSA